MKINGVPYLYKPINDIAVKNKLEQEQYFKISRFKEVIKRTKPHKHNAYIEILYLSEGAGFHWVDTLKFQITPPVIFILTAGQLHYWEMTAIPKGYVMLFKEEFFDRIRQSDLLNMVGGLEDTIEIPVKSTEDFDYIFDKMEKEYRSPSAYSQELIHGYLQVTLAKLLRHKKQQDYAQNNPPVFRKFLYLIRSANPVANLKVRTLATKLNTTPQNLNALCRKTSGKSASTLIREQVISEAKRYLLYSDKNISEIAFALNFTDSSHFVKYFKKYTGGTPQSFRSEHFNNT